MFNRRVLPGIIIFCGLLLFVGCDSSKSTPAGEFKKIDLRAKLPADIAAIKDEQAKEYTKDVFVGDPAAKVQIKWRTYKKENSAYTLSVVIYVPEATQGIQLTNATVQDPANSGTTDAVVQMNNLLIGWDASKTGVSHSGNFSGTIKADGEYIDSSK